MIETFRCQTLQQCTTLLRRMIEGRCRRWCIRAQPASGKRKCAACNLCGTRFSHGEARLQQWGNRQTNHHCVHAHCVNGGLGHDHELFPKQATDQDAVDAVTRQRDTITRTAADTEVLLPFAQDPDQALTAAPPDDEQDLFGREDKQSQHPPYAQDSKEHPECPIPNTARNSSRQTLRTRWQTTYFSSQQRRGSSMLPDPDYFRPQRTGNRMLFNPTERNSSEGTRPGIGHP